MKSFSAEAKAALASGDNIVSGAVQIGVDDPIFLWGGHGNLVIGSDVYSGVGDRALVTISGGSIGDAEAGAQLELSGVDLTVAGQLDIASLRNKPCVIWRLIFNGTGARLLQASVFLRGRIDSASSEDVPAGTATITIGVEGSIRGLGRRLERMHSDADQRLIKSTDGGFKRIAYAGEKTILWGGKPPQRTGAALNAQSFSLGGILNIVASQQQ